MQTSAKFCEVFTLKFAPFPLSTKLLRVICRSYKYFYHLQLHQTFILFCLLVSGRKNTTSTFRLTNVKDTLQLDQ